MNVGAAHQEEQGPVHSNELFPDYPGYADYRLTAKDKRVTHLTSHNLSYRIAHGTLDFKKDSLMDLNVNKDERQSPSRFLHVKDNTSDSDKRHNSTMNSKAGDKHHEGLWNDLVLKLSGWTQSNYENDFLSANANTERWSAASYDKGARSELFAVHGPSSSISLGSTYNHEFPSSYASALTRESLYVNKISSPISSSWNQKVKPPLNTKDFTPDHFLAWVIPMKDLDSLSSSASPLESLKNPDIAYRSSSLLQCQSSPYSSAFDNVLLRHKSEDSDVVSGYGRFSAYDWEPSEPFRPTFVISSSGRLSFASQYNPFCDSTEKSDKEDRALGAANVSHGTSCNAADEQVAGHLGRRLVRECENERCSGSSHNKCSNYGLKKDGYRVEREKFSGIGETAESIVKRENENVKNDRRSDNVKDTAKDRVRHRFELDEPHRMNWDGSRESRVLRNFRVSLIELVKEILRPTWEKGLIRKDVHNLIVKKSVEKVLNALELQNVPPSEELTKMIEGNVENYVKS